MYHIRATAIPNFRDLQHKYLSTTPLKTFAGISTKMAQNNAFTVAKRTLEGQDMIYQSIKLTNGIWALMGKF